MVSAQDPAQTIRVPEPSDIWRWLSHGVGAAWRYLTAREHLPLWAALVAAASLRLSALDLIPFGLTEVRFLEAGARTYEAAPGLFERALAVALWLGRDPRLAAGWLTLLNLVSLFVFHRVCARSFSARVAHLSTWLLSVTPWSVLLSRQIAPAALAMPLAALALTGLCLAVRAGKPLGWTLAWLSVLLLQAASPWATPALLGVVTLMLCFPGRVRWAHVLLGALLAAFVLLPIWYWAPEEAPWRILADHLTGSSAVAALQGSALSVAGDLASGQGLDALLALPEDGWSAAESALGGLAQLGGWLWLLTLPGLLLLAGRAWSRWREQDDPAAPLVPACTLWVPLLALWARQGASSPAELAYLLPPSALAMGMLLDRLLALPTLLRQGEARWAPWLRGIFWLFVASYLAWSAAAVINLYRHASEREASAAYGTPLRFWMRTASAATRSLQTFGLREVRVLLQEEEVALSDGAATLAYLLQGRAEAAFLAGSAAQAMLLPAERDALYLSLGSDAVRDALLDAWGGQLVAQVLFPAPLQAASLRWVPAQATATLLAAIPYRDWAAYDAGLRLVGYEAPSLLDGQALVLTTYWTFEDVLPDYPGGQHRFTWLLYGQDGALMARAVPFGLPEAAWRPGRLLQQWHTLALPDGLPAGPYEAHLLVERWPGGSRSYLLDEQGRPLADRYIIGPFLFE